MFKLLLGTVEIRLSRSTDDGRGPYAEEVGELVPFPDQLAESLSLFQALPETSLDARESDYRGPDSQGTGNRCCQGRLLLSQPRISLLENIDLVGKTCKLLPPCLNSGIQIRCLETGQHSKLLLLLHSSISLDVGDGDITGTGSSPVSLDGLDHL